MNVKRNLSIILLTIITLLSGAGAPLAQAAPVTTYVEPALLTAPAGQVSVIVAARDSRSAAGAVERVGGQVTSDLWLIDAVAATIPASQVKVLAGISGIQSIVGNHGV